MRSPTHRVSLAPSLVLALGLPFLAYAGGYVPPNGTLLQQATSVIVPGQATTAAVPTFNNATLTDQNTIAEANNNLVKTPLTSDPVSTVTGNNIHDETDFVIKGRAGLNYAFTRSYNSAPSSTKTDLGLGYGWVHSYGMRLKSNDYGACPNCTTPQAPENGNGKTSSITYTDERGGDHNHLVNESTWAVTPPQGEFDSLAFNAPSSGQHTLTFRNGAQYVFQTVGTGDIRTTPNVTARLIRIADLWGNQLNFTYTASDATGRLISVTDNLGIVGRSGLIFTYDAGNHLQSISDWSGRTWQYNVNASGNLASFTTPLAQTTAYGYGTGSGLHDLLTIARPLRGATTTFAYYQNGRTFNYRDALGHTETLDYDLYRKSTRVTDPRGGIREYEYDSAGRMTKLTEPDGAILQFQNQADGLRYSKTDGIGYQTQYSYRGDRTFNTASDTYGNVTREQDALGQTIDTGYGPYDQIASVKDKRGNTVTTSFHSGSGACIAAGKPKDVTLSTLSGVTSVKLKTWCWNSDGTLASLTEYPSPTDPGKTRVTAFTYDSAHLNVQSVTVSGWDGATVSKTFTYDTLGRPQTETLARRISPSNAATTNLVTTTTWDALDRATQVQDPAGNLFINRFDANGQLWQVTHQYKRPDGSYDTRDVLTRSFDAADRVLAETDALGGVTSYSYDAAGNVIAVTDPEAHTLAYDYDEMNRRTAVLDANGHSVKTAWDLAGHPVSVTNGAGETTVTAYDALGRLTSVTDAHGFIATMSYDANGNVTCVVDANAQAGLQPKNSDGCTVSTQYDELNRPDLIRDALNGVTRITYDLLGNPLTRIDAEGRQYAWRYDGLGRLTGETDFAGNTTSYALDQAGNVFSMTNRLGQVTQTAFDALNRPGSVNYLADGSGETYSYDPAGNLASTTNAAVGYSFQYDALNRLLSKLDSRGRSLGFTWDRSGHMLTKTTYQGSTTSYTWDGAGTLVSLSNPDYLTVSYQYDDAGRLLSRVMSSGARSLYTYDNGGWLQSLAHTDAMGTTVVSQGYSRDRVGNITATNVTVGPIAGTTSYTLDALYRLTQVNAPGTANDEAFSYDHLGNRLIATRGSTTVGASGTGISSKYYLYTAATQTGNPGYTATYNNRLSSIRIGSPGGTVDSGFSFDNEGRLTSQTGATPRTLTWDARNRLKTLAQGGTTETYRYDPTNHRIGRSGGPLGNLDYYLEGEHLESVEQSGTLQEKYFRGSTVDELVAGYLMHNGTLTPLFFQHDQITSVIAETKPNGGTQAAMSYFAFGETQTTTGTPIGRLKFTGREDEGNGCYFYRARYYCPALGQFLSEDPKKFSAGQNFYAYVGNNPTNANDPSGLRPGDIYGVGPATNNPSFVTRAKDAANLATQSLFVQKPSYIHVATEILPLDGTRRIAEAVPSGVRIVNFSDWVAGERDAGRAVARYAPVTPYDQSQLRALTRFAESKVGSPYDWTAYLGSKDTYRGEFICSEFCNTAASNALGPRFGQSQRIETPFGNLAVPSMPSQIQESSNYQRIDVLDTYWSPNGSLLSGGGAAGGGLLLYPNKANTNMMRSVYSK